VGPRLGLYFRTGGLRQIMTASPQFAKRQGLLYGHTGKARTARWAAEQPNHQDGQAPGSRPLKLQLETAQIKFDGRQGGGTKALTGSPATVVVTYLPSLEWAFIVRSTVNAPFNSQERYLKIWH
jgi:hypothetical protein